MERKYYILTPIVIFLICSLYTGAESLSRGPYLQQMTPSSVIIIWRTDTPTDSVVFFGTDPEALTQSIVVSSLNTQHEVLLTGLVPSTRYYYSIGSSTQTLANGLDYFFITSPPIGTRKPLRFWVLGDSGTGNKNARAVRDAMITEIGENKKDIDLWLMLGDNAYGKGTDMEYQERVFDMYPSFLRNFPLWPTLGNHDGASADSSSQTGPYYDIFVLPKAAEAGGLPSGTEAYYSFDYANIHFICLDSHESPRKVSDPMLQWTMQDAAATNQDWIIAFWHHPPYSHGSHNSDLESKLIDMRENALPILEAAGVDIILCGHSHSFERSFFVSGAYNTPTTSSGHILDNGNGREDGDGIYTKRDLKGAVYIVAGASGKIEKNETFDHPLMFFSLAKLGSMVIDIDHNRLDAFYLDDLGDKIDHFTIIKDSVPPLTIERQQL